jgi:hypothetical protein
LDWLIHKCDIHQLLVQLRERGVFGRANGLVEGCEREDGKGAFLQVGPGDQVDTLRYF